MPTTFSRRFQLERTILKAAEDAGVRGITVEELVEAAYGGMPDGGPLYANSAIYATISRLRSLGKIKSRQQRTTYFAPAQAPPPVKEAS